MKKTALITGASRGIGKEIARQFAQIGYQVVINYNHSQYAAETLAAELTAQAYSVLAIKADVTSQQEVRHMVAIAESHFGQIDVLVNNAAIAQQTLFTETTETEWNRLFSVNVTGLFHCCQAVLPSMIAQQNGCIINLSSMWGIVGASCEVAYSATKAAIIGMTKALAKELALSHIRVNCVAPGVIDTEMNAALGEETLQSLKEETPLGILGTPKDIADTVLFLASEQAHFYTGQVFQPNGGFLM